MIISTLYNSQQICSVHPNKKKATNFLLYKTGHLKENHSTLHMFLCSIYHLKIFTEIFAQKNEINLHRSDPTFSPILFFIIFFFFCKSKEQKISINLMLELVFFCKQMPGIVFGIWFKQSRAPFSLAKIAIASA